MRLDQVMSTPAVTVTPETSVKSAAEIMSARGFTVLPVVDANLELVGIVSEGDLIADRFPRDARQPARIDEETEHLPTTVGAVMTRVVISAALHEAIRAVIARMRAARVRAVPVCDEGRVVGVVTYQDLVRVLARDDKRIAADVRRILRFYTSPDRFIVRAHEGALELVDTMEKAEEWPTVRHLTEQVPGVVTAQVVRPSAATG